MQPIISGATIKALRQKQQLTQRELAERLNVSYKTISKWETGRGCPDISLLNPLATVFGVSLTELLSGNPVQNQNPASNMMRSMFYVCPICGNSIHCMGEAVVQCHGLPLIPQQQKPSDEDHKIFIEKVEDEYFVRVEHPMEKAHHISFLAAVSGDRLQLVKLYPEGNAEARFKINLVKKVFCYCNRDGLFVIDVLRGVDDKETCYDTTQERRELEQAAKFLFES